MQFGGILDDNDARFSNKDIEELINRFLEAADHINNNVDPIKNARHPHVSLTANMASITVEENPKWWPFNYMTVEYRLD